jgi:hypothetical protein
MTLSREPMKELEAFARENNVNHKDLLDAVNEKIKQLRAESFAKKEIDLPDILRQTLEAFVGDIKYIKERRDNPGYLIVTHDEENGYKAVMVDTTDDGHELLPIDDDFPEQEQAIDYLLMLEKAMMSEHPKHGDYSDLKLFHVHGEGHYVGRERYDGIFTRWMPFSRVNEKPIKDRHEAESFLKQVLQFRSCLMNFSTGNLKVTARSIHEAIPADPWNEFRRNIAIDELRVIHKVKPHVLAELLK